MRPSWGEAGAGPETEKKSMVGPKTEKKRWAQPWPASHTVAGEGARGPGGRGLASPGRGAGPGRRDLAGEGRGGGRGFADEGRRQEKGRVGPAAAPSPHRVGRRQEEGRWPR